MLIRKYDSGAFDILLDDEAKELVTYEKGRRQVFDTLNECMFWDDLSFSDYDGEWYIVDYNRQHIFYIGGHYHLNYLQWFENWVADGFIELDPWDEYDTDAYDFFFGDGGEFER